MAKITVKETRVGFFYFVLNDRQGNTLFKSQDYTSLTSANRGVKRFQQLVAEAELTVERR